VQDGALLRITATFASELSGSRFGDLALSGPAPVADAVFSPDLHAAIYSILGDLTTGDERGRGGSVQVRGADGALRQTLSGYVNEYARLAISPDGALLAIANDGSIYLVDAEQALLKRVLNTDEDVAALAFSPDGRLLALATKDGQVLLYGVP
jgi:WD40 repeat protein